MKTNSIYLPLRILLLVSFILVAISVAASLWSAQTARSGAVLLDPAAIQKITILPFVQIAAAVGALLLLLAGALLAYRIWIKPVQELGSAAVRISLGDQAVPVNQALPLELRPLADALETIRQDLQISQQRLLEWNEFLEVRVAQRTLELDALYEVSRDISSRLDIHHVLRSVTNKARQLLEAEVAFLCLLEKEDEILSLKAASGPLEAVQTKFTSVKDPLAAHVLAERSALPCEVGGCLGCCEIVSETYQTSHLAAPLFVGERVIGALCVGSSRKNTFREDSIDLLTKLASAAAVALENARLFAQAEQVATMEERQRLASEIHDGLGQTLSYLGLVIDQVTEELEDNQKKAALDRLLIARTTVSRAVQEVRGAITSLIEATPAGRNLVEQLRSLVGEVEHPTEISLAFVTNLSQPVEIPRSDTEMILRAVREALINAVRHSGGHHVRVKLARTSEEIQISVEDDGRGFDPECIPQDRRRHFGVQIMQARAAHLGGSVQIQSQPGEGTQVHFTFPVKHGWVDEKLGDWKVR